MTLKRWVSTLTLPLALAMALTSCSGGGGAAPTPDSANSPETARAYGDCLTAEGIDGVFVDDEGVVGVSVQATSGGDGSDTGDTSFDLDGDSGGLYAAAEEKCRTAVPAYRQPESVTDPAVEAALTAQSREFARCARQNGIADFPDPDASAGGKLVVPAGTTKSLFLAVVTICASAFSPVSSPTDPAAGDSGDSDSGTGVVTLALPSFGGAYESSWSAEVSDILFTAMQPGGTAGP